MDFFAVPKAQPGDRVAIVSPSFAAPGFAPAVHEQGMRRIAEEWGLDPVELPATRKLDASAKERAADINVAFADPSIRAIFSSLGGDDQITVIPHLDRRLAVADPKPFLGYSDNTNILNWLWQLGVGGFYGGSTQVHIGSGPHIDQIHADSLRAAVVDGGELNIWDPGESEDFGPDWRSAEALTQFGEREQTQPWVWAGHNRVAEGRTWGGCIEVLDQIALAGRLPPLASLQGTILLLESSEELPPAGFIRRWARGLGERGVLSVVDGVMVARPPVSTHGAVPPAEERSRLRSAQADVVLSELSYYNDDTVICIGVPFGHTRPQWILPYGGHIRLDGVSQQITASFA